MDDLNTDLLSEWNDAKFVRRLSEELCLQLIQHSPTHFTQSSSTWLDVILVDDIDMIIDSSNIPAAFHNDHNIITTSISYNSIQVPNSKTIQYRDFKNLSVSDLNNFLSLSNWSYSSNR